MRKKKIFGAIVASMMVTGSAQATTYALYSINSLVYVVQGANVSTYNQTLNLYVTDATNIKTFTDGYQSIEFNKSATAFTLTLIDSSLTDRYTIGGGDPSMSQDGLPFINVLTGAGTASRQINHVSGPATIYDIRPQSVTTTFFDTPQNLHTVSFGALVPSAAPEPATWAMMVGGFGLVGSAMRRRKVSVSFA